MIGVIQRGIPGRDNTQKAEEKSRGNKLLHILRGNLLKEKKIRKLKGRNCVKTLKK